MIQVVAFALASQTPSPQELLDRSKHFYESARTFQGDIVIQGVERGTHNWQRTRVRSIISAKGVVVCGDVIMDRKQDGATQTMHMIDDGKNMYMVDYAHKGYLTQAHQEVSPFAMFGIIGQFMSAPGAKPSSAIAKDGKGYVINLTPNGVKTVIRFDKRYALQQIHYVNAAKEPYDISVSNQSFGQPLSLKLFQWKPPKDFKKLDQR